MLRNFYKTVCCCGVVVVLVEFALRLTGLGMAWNMDSVGRRKSASVSSQPAKGLVVAAGDSLSFGARVLERDSYPSELEARLKGGWPGWEVVNMGISGHTSTQLRERFEKHVLTLHPQVVVLWVGANDGLLKKSQDSEEPGKRPFDRPPILARSVLLATIDALPAVMHWRGSQRRSKEDFRSFVPRVPLARFQENLTAMVRQLKSQEGNTLILLTIPRLPGSFSENAEYLELQRQSHSRYNQVIRQVAADYELPCIDSQALLADQHFLADGLHPTPQGYEIIAGEIWRRLQQTLAFKKEK